jgi:hypothetical protein
MRGTAAKWIVTLGAGAALIVALEYRKQPASAPVQPVAISLPRVQLDFPVGSLPVEEVDAGAVPRVDRGVPPQQVQPIPVEQPADAQPAAVAETQRLQDARLFEEQEAASERQQEELNQDIGRDVKTQDEMQAEPRIQGIPEVPVESTQPE